MWASERRTPNPGTSTLSAAMRRACVGVGCLNCHMRRRRATGDALSGLCGQRGVVRSFVPRRICAHVLHGHARPPSLDARARMVLHCVAAQAMARFSCIDVTTLRCSLCLGVCTQGSAVRLHTRAAFTHAHAPRAHDTHTPHNRSATTLTTTYGLGPSTYNICAALSRPPGPQRPCPRRRA